LAVRVVGLFLRLQSIGVGQRGIDEQDIEGCGSDRGLRCRSR